MIHVSRISALSWAISATFAAIVALPSASALELDWSGQFRAENHFIGGYISDVAGSQPGGYGVKSGGESTAQFQTLFMRLRPKAVVNDNVFIKSEFWLGDPIFGMFGNGIPYSVDQRQFYSNQSRGSFITAQRYWGEFQTDLGLVQVGRMPLQYGLGVTWNAGDGLYDRYQSTGDTIRYLAKLGSLTFAPAIVKYSLGNSFAGACNVGAAAGLCVQQPGRGNAYDWSLMAKYEVLDEDLELSVNLIRHIVDAAQDNTAYQVPGALPTGGQIRGGTATTTYDIFAKKKLGKLTLAAEVPVVSGDVAGIKRSTVGFAVEVAYKASNSFDALLKFGRAPGQQNFSGSTPDNFNAFYFNPNYRLGLIMFNYQMNNFAGPASLNNPNTSPTQLASPFDNPITNANYVALSTGISADKWQFRPGFVLGVADQAAVNGSNFLNSNSRSYFTNASGKDQGKFLGMEFDLGITYQMDEAFSFGIDTGIFLPGSYYKFSNSANDNNTSTVFANVLRVGVNF